MMPRSHPEADEAAAAIQTRRLCKSFGRARVLRDVDLSLYRGDCVALTGANGAGKTTLLRCLASVLRPSSGEVRWFGALASAHRSERRSLTFLAHESLLYPHLTLHENLVFAGRMYGMPDPKHVASRWLNQTGLGPHAAHFPGQLSRGMRQRLAVARALIHEPRIILLDEPFSSLDRQGAQWLGELVHDLSRRGRTICFATHDERAVQRVADRVARIERGRLTFGNLDQMSRGLCSKTARRAA